MEMLCNRLEHHAAVFILSMLKTNAAAWCLHSLCGNAVGSFRAPWGHRVWSRCLQCVLIIKQMIIKCIKIYKVFIIINANGLSFIKTNKNLILTIVCLLF